MAKQRKPAKRRKPAKQSRAAKDVGKAPDPTVGEADLKRFGAGSHPRLWRCLGARWREVDGAAGFAFSVWAPNARRVSLVGDFCAWDGSRHPMRRLGDSGVFDLFVPGFREGDPPGRFAGLLKRSQSNLIDP